MPASPVHYSKNMSEGEPFKPPPPASRPPAAPFPSHASLPNMPLEVIEIIGQPLSLRERVSLTSCCHALAADPAIPSSAALWGALDLSPQPPQRQASLARWLARRRQAVRVLRLEGPAEAFGSLLTSLAGGPLEQLQLQALGCAARGGKEGGVEAVLGPLKELTSLTRLRAHGLHFSNGLPSKMAALSALLELDLGRSHYSCGGGAGGADVGGAGPAQQHAAAGGGDEEGEEGVGEGEGGVAGQPLPLPMPSLAPQLTQLSLSSCGLKALPSELSSLTALASLDVSSNMALRRGDADAFAPLACLAGLRRLDLGQCYLEGLPSELEALTGLRELLASRNHLGLGAPGQGARAAWRPLKALSALTSLDVTCCGLHCLPPQLSSLPALAEVRAGSNQLLAYGGEAAFAELRHLAPTLRALDLSHCELLRLPQVLSALAALTRLDVSCNMLASEAAWAPVGGLSGLRQLGARGCGRQPAALAPLRGLVEVDLGGACDGGAGSGVAAGPAGQQLQYLAAVSALARACRP